MAAPTKLNATSAALLGFLHGGPLSGWDLVTTAQQTIGDFWTITRSQVYRELAAMAGAGLIEAEPSGARDRRPYTLTDTGRAAFSEWIHREPPAETIRFPLLLTLAFGEHVEPERLAAFIRSHRAVHAERLTAYEQLRRDLTAARQQDPTVISDVQLATLDFGRHYEAAVVRWFDELPPSIRGGRDNTA